MHAPVVLAVCSPSSFCAARWLNLLRASKFKIVIFPSTIQPLCREFAPWRPVTTSHDVDDLGPGEIGLVDQALRETMVSTQEDRELAGGSLPPHADVVPQATPTPDILAAMITELKPTLLHSFELQRAGYLCLEVRRQLADAFPSWLASCWGSDIFLHRKLRNHSADLSELFRVIDSLHTECARDLELAVELGFSGHRFPVISRTGGANLDDYPDPALLPPPSQRKVILIKGSHDWSGRGMNVLMAVHRMAPLLRDFRIRVTHSSTPVQLTVEQIAHEDGLDIAVDPYRDDPAKAIARLAEARLVVGAGIADGLSVTLLEAMTVGSFCIESDTSCAVEWITPGQTGLIVSPHDIGAISNAIKTAISDDALVDRASLQNRTTILKRWSEDVVRPVILEGYRHLIQDGAVTA